MKVNYQTTTSRIERLLKSSPEAINGIDFANLSFGEYISAQLEKNHIPKTELASNIEIGKTYAYDIMKGTQIPSRDVILRITRFLKLNLEETQRTLALAKKAALYAKDKRDATIMTCIIKDMSLSETEAFLIITKEKSLFNNGTDEKP